MKKLTWPIALVCSIGLGAFYYFKVYDDGSALLAQINEIKGRIAEQETKKVETDKVKADEQKIKDEVGKLAEQFKEVTARFPVSLKSDEIISTINKLAKSANVRVIAVKKLDVQVQELYEEIPMSIDLAGTFNSLLVLMYNIATLERVTNLGDFEFSNLNGEYDGNLKLSTKVMGYKYRKPPDAPTEAKAGQQTNAQVPGPGGGQ